jgi:hypothetical protein
MNPEYKALMMLIASIEEQIKDAEGEDQLLVSRLREIQLDAIIKMHQLI